MSEALQISIESRVAHVRLNRPDAHNAIEGEIMNGLIEFAGSMMDPGEVRAIVLSGNGKSFCAGLDMSAFAEMSSGEQALQYGLATDLSETTTERALAMAATIAGRNPDAVRAAKQICNNAALVDVPAGLAQEAAATRQLLGSPNQLEAVTAQFEGRAAEFRD